MCETAKGSRMGESSFLNRKLFSRFSPGLRIHFVCHIPRRREGSRLNGIRMAGPSHCRGGVERTSQDEWTMCATATTGNNNRKWKVYYKILQNQQRLEKKKLLFQQIYNGSGKCLPFGTPPSSCCPVLSSGAWADCKKIKIENALDECSPPPSICTQLHFALFPTFRGSIILQHDCPPHPPPSKRWQGFHFVRKCTYFCDCARPAPTMKNHRRWQSYSENMRKRTKRTCPNRMYFSLWFSAFQFILFGTFSRAVLKVLNKGCWIQFLRKL